MSRPGNVRIRGLSHISSSGFAVRRSLLGSSLADANLDVLVVSSSANIRYLSGFTGSNAVLLVAPSGSLLLTDPRYEIQARTEVDCPVRVVRKSLWAALPTLLVRRPWKSIGIEPGQLPVEQYHALQAQLPLGRSLEPAPPLVERARTVKSSSEIELIRQSVRTCSAAYERVLKSIRPGFTELDLAARLDYEMRRLGAAGSAFETIVASGPRSSLPHARPTSAPIRTNQLLLIDMGAMQDGYASDMTRTIYLGRPTARVKRIYAAVLQAQLAAIDAVRPGATAGDVDRSARLVLRKHGLDKAFVHSTGHGLGLEIHEAPRIGRNDPTVLQPGMVVTVEPGAYLEGFGGIRIEDTVLIRENGCEVLTRTGKELLAL